PLNIIQIGCFDGDDHVFKFISENASQIHRAVLVEPLLAKLREAEARYRDYPFVEFHNVAVVDTHGISETPFYFPRDLVHGQISSLNSEHVRKHRDDLEEVVVKCVHVEK